VPHDLEIERKGATKCGRGKVQVHALGNDVADSGTARVASLTSCSVNDSDLKANSK
jgi:hypothetical protein